MGANAEVMEVVQRTLLDADYAAKVKASAIKAFLGGSSSPDFRDFMNLFATSPDQLKDMATVGAAACTCNSTTVTTLTSPMCTGTTTTGSGG